MKSLTTIQKTFKVFMTLSRIAMILSFVWAGFAALGLLCGIVWYTGGTVIGAEQHMLLSLTSTEGLGQMLAVLSSDLLFALVDGKLMLLAYRYFRQEQADGTPFTHGGADQIKRLGIFTIVFPLIAIILSAVFYELQGISHTPDWSNQTSVYMGIVLILASLVFHYGAELEGKERQE